MSRPKQSEFEKIRTRAWFNAVSRQSGLTAYQIERELGDTSKSWQKYKLGRYAPNAATIQRTEDKWPHTRRFFSHGPANLFAAARVDSLTNGFALFLSHVLEPRYHGIMARFQGETAFTGTSAQGIVAFSKWLSKTALREPNFLPLAVSASLVTRRFLDSEEISAVIVEGAASFEEQYDMGRNDFFMVDADLISTYRDAA